LTGLVFIRKQYFKQRRWGVANPQKENGYNKCVICERVFILSDPNTFEYDNNKSICKECWGKTPESWGARRKKTIIFEYIKVKIPHSLKWKIWKRDGFKCLFCGSQETLTIDHKYPESLGGNLSEENLQTLCDRCNKKKNNKI
jgi:5-methylcytosine-specific restriction endonuclease McrA